MALPRTMPVEVAAPVITPAVEPLHLQQVRLVSVQEFLDMHERGIYTADDRLELIEGWMVEKMTKKPPHIRSANLLLRLLLPLLSEEWTLNSETPVVLERSIPEPDFSILRGPLDGFADRLPTAADVALVIEIADTTLASDRAYKRKLYAEAGIPEYWLVNISDRQIEVCTGPDSSTSNYAQIAVFSDEESLPLVLDGQEIARLSAADILP